jgi:two-component system KDP operon response regulator KdpE
MMMHPKAEHHPRVLLVDDEAQLRRLLRFSLEAAGFEVREAESGRIALGEIALKVPELVILDLGLPDIAGIEVLRTLRQMSFAPVLILSVLEDEPSKIAALDAGADDYLTKPFSGGELVARLHALLRRIHPVGAGISKFSFGPIDVDFDKSRVLRDGRPIRLTPLEFKLLRTMVLHPDKVLTHQHILGELWGPKATSKKNYLRIYMMNLRRKLGEEIESAGHFQTESGIGYRFVSDPTLAARSNGRG